jgi:hypothetical protein
MLRSVVLVRKDVAVENITCIIRLTRIGGLGTLTELRLLVTANVVPSSLILVALMMKALRSSEA